jgi:hypothetical protein
VVKSPKSVTSTEFEKWQQQQQQQNHHDDSPPAHPLTPPLDSFNTSQLLQSQELRLPSRRLLLPQIERICSVISGEGRPVHMPKGMVVR